MDANSHLFQLERRKQILAMLESEGKILVKDLEKIFSVSGATIRSDLNDMEKEGLLLRTHGGAMEIQKTGEDASLEDRSKKRIKQKTAIAKVALSLIEPGESLFVDGGTTLTQFIQCLVEHPIKDLTILTNYHPHVLHLNECPEIKTVFIGGVYDEEYHLVVVVVHQSSSTFSQIIEIFLTIHRREFSGLFSRHLDQ